MPVFTIAPLFLNELSYLTDICAPPPVLVIVPVELLVRLAAVRLNKPPVVSEPSFVNVLPIKHSIVPELLIIPVVPLVIVPLFVKLFILVTTPLLVIVPLFVIVS